MRVGLFLLNSYVSGAFVPTSVQLVDVEAGTIADALCSEADGVAATQDLGEVSAENPVMHYAAYDAQTGEDVLAFVLGVGILEVPVVPIAEIDLRGVETLTETDPSDLIRPVSALEAYPEELDCELFTREESDGVVITISSDVLFEKDSATLSSAAEASLDRAAERLEGSSGELLIVGHTDDVETHEANLILSRERAASVEHALSARGALGDLEVTVEDRSYDEPAIEATTEAARAANRRIQLLVDAITAPDAGSGPEASELLEGSGPRAFGATGVDNEARPFGSTPPQCHVALSEVTQYGDYLGGEVDLTNTGDESAGLISVLSLGAWDARGKVDFTLQAAADAHARPR